MRFITRSAVPLRETSNRSDDNLEGVRKLRSESTCWVEDVDDVIIRRIWKKEPERFWG